MKRTACFVFAAVGVLLLGSWMGENPRPDLSFLTPAARDTFLAAGFAPLGKPMNPPNNPTTPAKAELGRLLYFDARLSADGTVSCASCHHPEKAWGDGEKTALGIRKQRGPRNSPSVLDSAFYSRFFWDARAASLEEQAFGPIENPVEMGNSRAGMTTTLERIAGYRPLFREAFGSETITADRVAQAIAAFERTVVSGPSAFDRFLMGENNALTAAQKRGLQAFLVNGDCAMCHRGPFLTNEMRLAGIRVPSLRNVALTAPYFSDGSAATIEEAIRKRGPRPLTDAERKDLEAFLGALSGQSPKISAAVRLPE